MSQNRLTGGNGEDQAAAWYLANGYEILDRNWRSGRLGEIDIVARKSRELVVSEVKTRTSVIYGHPAEAITAAKQTRLRRLGASYLSAHNGLGVDNLRFDVFCILDDELEVWPGVF